MAQAATPGQNPVLDWVQYGVLGLVVLGLITGKLVTGRSFDREAARADRYEAKLDALNTHMSEKVIPLLARAAGALEARGRQEGVA